MKKNILFVSILSWTLMGCPSGPPLLGTGFDPTTSVTSCDPHTDVAVCSGDKESPKVIFDLDNFDFVPKCVIAQKGRYITVELVSASKIEKDSVTLFPKDPGNYSWLAGTNDPTRNKIKIKVPRTTASGETFPDGTYHYGIWTDGKCIDPRVRVVN